MGISSPLCSFAVAYPAVALSLHGQSSCWGTPPLVLLFNGLWKLYVLPLSLQHPLQLVSSTLFASLAVTGPFIKVCLKNLGKFCFLLRLLLTKFGWRDGKRREKAGQKLEAGNTIGRLLDGARNCMCINQCITNGN